ncbi:MAG: SUMF1/EgtB/PvdO family nonheme iron enzyme [Polyangiaceae bacterium]|nr:SUMF1/EgtB/PvdO family nonheme iron enzyme [Polyangiaceae bacterium]
MLRPAHALRTLAPALLLVWLTAPSCKSSRASDGAATTAAATAPAPAPAASLTPDAAEPADAAAADLAPPARTEGCEAGMVRVEGDYCPAVMQDCVEHHPEYKSRKGEKTVSERCMKYKQPSTCVSKERKRLSFCVDRYEWPNQVGQLPRVLTSWLEAKALCEKAGKRLCTEDEFNFACEGPEMLPYATGYVRDQAKCNIDKPYVQPDQSRQMATYDKCPDNEFCRSEMKRLDQRHAIGAKHSCVSWAGVVDINGNVNEWVEIPGEKHPNRSGLKGGWWGPVRSRCRPTVTFHKEFDYGYEAGFRCCKDTK